MSGSASNEAGLRVPAGEPRASAGARLWPLVLAAALLFALDTYLVATRPLLPFDVPLAQWVQAAPWGPIARVFELINATSGYVQFAAGAIAVALIFAWDRRAGLVMAIGAVSCLLGNVMKVAMARPRPSPDLVHVLVPEPGYSYPSGHAVFFTWLCLMLGFSIAPHLRPSGRRLLWFGGALIITFACLARVWAGVHWPSDVLGGFLLGFGWSALVVWLPERWQSWSG